MVTPAIADHDGRGASAPSHQRDWIVAVHEAGHCVAALKFGFGVATATIVADGKGTSGRVTYANYPLGDYDECGLLTEEPPKRLVVQSCIASYAGRAAEDEFGLIEPEEGLGDYEEPEPGGCDDPCGYLCEEDRFDHDDGGTALYWLTRLGDYTVDPNQLQHAARRLIHKQRELVQIIAERLIEKRNLTGDNLFGDW